MVNSFEFSTRKLIALAPIWFSVIFIVVFSLRIGLTSDELFRSGGDFSFQIDPDSRDYRLAIVSTLAMAMPLSANFLFELYHLLNGPDRTNSQQMSLSACSFITEGCILVTTIVTSILLLTINHRRAFWLVAHIQVLTLVEFAYFFINVVCRRNAMTIETIIFPSLAFVTAIVHFESILHEQWNAHVGLLVVSLVLMVVLVGMSFQIIYSLREAIQTNQADQVQVLPEEQLSMVYALSLCAWLLGYLVFYLCLNDGVDFCLVHTLFVAALAFALGVSNSMKTKQAAAIAETALETKRIFVRHVSHEIRTPLNTTIIGLQLLEAELKKPALVRDENLLSDLVADVNTSSVIAVDILNDLLLYEKIEGGLMALELAEVEAWDMIKEVLRVFRIQAKSSQINLEYPDVCADGYFIKVDKYKLSQVIRNLVSNALKFTSPNGRVSVVATVHKNTEGSTRRSRNTMKAMKFVEAVFPSKEFIRLSVTDTGVGISKEDQRRLFREIVQFDAAKLQKGQGSGLGLWISSRIVRLHGGKIGVMSEGNNTGSTFYVDLPISRYYVEHPLDGMISSSLKENYGELFSSNSTTHLTHASSAKNASGKSNGSYRSNGSKRRERSMQLDSPIPLMESSQEDLEANTPLNSPHTSRSRVYSNDSVNSFLLVTAKPSSPHAHSPSANNGNRSPKRSRGSSMGIVPESEPSPLGSLENSKESEDPVANASPQSTPSRVRRNLVNSEESYADFFQRRILIVDDAPTNRKVVNRLLRDKIAHRDEAANGKEACVKCKESLDNNQPYDCIILDYYMPELDGPGAAEQMRKMGYKGVIVGVTGNNDSNDIAKFCANGANHVLVKPLDANLFWQILTEQMSQANVEIQV